MLQIKEKLKILHFDIENRPLSYWADRPTAEITAIASCWSDDPQSMQVLLLRQGDNVHEQQVYILSTFKSRYDEADMVTGHYIRKHDLPIINGALMEHGLKQLNPKLTSDTKLDMKVKGDLPATQKDLADMLGIKQPKVGMSQAAWREANRLTTRGVEATERRARGDVEQHMALRNKMVELGLLKGPKIWKG